MTPDPAVAGFSQLVEPAGGMYIVHMKRITASEARRNWFRILDEVAAGATVIIERHGRRIVLRREDEEARAGADRPDYSALLSLPDAERADSWGWEWSREGELEPRDIEPDS